jgi:hypothetical protein
VVLYLPRVGFALPLPFLIIGLALCRQWKWLFTQGAACVLLLFCLMGLRIGLGKHWSNPAARLRLLSFNINLSSQGADAISALIRSVNPDIACLQEGLGNEAKVLHE